ncbi:MAG: ComF family protein, partial [Nitrospirae bacterium]|nr:ComF family protein [Nitrospirota bacterium]
SEGFFCGPCGDMVRPYDGPRCGVCGRHFPDGSGSGHTCYDCTKKPPVFEAARAKLAYDGPVREAIRLYKYGRIRKLRSYLGGFMEDGARDWFPDSDVVCAVPLHRRRLRDRGFNQSLFLAESAALAVGARLSLDGLARVRYTAPQVGMGHAERLANVKGAFEVARPGEFAGARVLLVDDVYTTGATVNECARVLMKAGAASVRVLTVARA